MSSELAPTMTPLEVAQFADSPAKLLALAISQQTPPEALAKLMDLAERFDANRARKEFCAAMAACKKELPAAIEKGSSVDFKDVHYKFANLGDAVETVVPTLAKHGFDLSWEPSTPKDGFVTVKCFLTHSGGHCKTAELSGPADKSGSKNAIQAIGSAITYLERYTALAVLGIATKDLDDDGRAAGQPIDQGYREPDPDKLYGNGVKKPTENPPTASGGGSWTGWRDKVLDRVIACMDGDTLQTAKTWLAAQKCPADIRAELDHAIRTKQDGLDIEGSFATQDAGVNQEQPTDADAARKAEETWTVPIMGITTLLAIAEFKQHILPMIDAALRPHVEKMLLIHELTMAPTITRCLAIKKEHPELGAHVDRRITEIKDAMQTEAVT